MSILESIARQRALLDYPMSNRPSLHQLYAATMRNFQGMYNRLANSNQSFAQDEKYLTVNSNNDTYTVSSDSRFGKVLLVTTYSTDPQAVERSIDFHNIRDLNFDVHYPANYEGTWFSYLTGGDHSAERMGFYYTPEGSLKVRISPKPQRTATYKIRYSLGDWAKDAQLEESPILTQYHDLFEIRTAKDVLYMCAWDGLSAEERQQKLKEIGASLYDQEMRYLKDFELYLRTITIPKIVRKSAWNE